HAQREHEPDVLLGDGVERGLVERGRRGRVAGAAGETQDEGEDGGLRGSVAVHCAFRGWRNARQYTPGRSVVRAGARGGRAGVLSTDGKKIGPGRGNRPVAGAPPPPRTPPV